MIKAIAKLIYALNSNMKKTQIAAGIAWGMMLGLIPTGNFFWIVLFLVSFFFNHHHGIKIAFMALFILISPSYVMLIDRLGWEILHIEALVPMYTSLFNMPFVPFTKFNNTLVIGGLAAGLVLFFPVYFLFLPIIVFYRNKISPKLRNSAIIKTIAKFPFLKAIEKALASMGK